MPSVCDLAPPVSGKEGAGRGFIVGRSGSGKSFLARNLLACYRSEEDHPAARRAYLLLVDPNHTLDYPHNIVATRPDQIAPGPKAPVVLYRPGDGEDGAEAWNEVWRRALETRGRLMVYVDEAYAMEALFGVRRVPGGVNYLNAYLTRGRALGKGALLVAQRPVLIPRNIVGQATHFYMFDLPLQDDRDFMTGTIGRMTADGRDLRDRRALGRYEFAFLGPQDRAPGGSSSARRKRWQRDNERCKLMVDRRVLGVSALAVLAALSPSVLEIREDAEERGPSHTLATLVVFGGAVVLAAWLALGG